MARYSSPRSPKATTTNARPRPNPDPLAQQAPLVSAKWLLWSLAGIFGGGLLLVYLTVCLLFWQGSWQILFQPSLPVSALLSGPDAKGRELVQFDTTETGQPQLQGLFLKTTEGSPYANRTILYLPGTKADASTITNATLGALQEIGIGAFTFNYRGLGAERKQHPSEELATEDTEAAWRYLVETRHVPATSIVFYGRGLGASLAAEASRRHPDAAGLVLDDPSPTALELLHADARSNWLPIGMLTHDRFDPVAALAASKQPKLFLLHAGNAAGKRYAAVATAPKLIVYPGASPTARQDALRRFLGEQP